jgi:hypothetical protein
VRQDSIKASSCLCNEEMGAEFILKNKDFSGTFMTPVRVMFTVSGSKIILEDNVQWVIKQVSPIEVSSQ